MSPAFNLQTCARPNILALEPYRCARDDYKDDGTNVLLDANENAYGPPFATNATTTTTDASSNGSSQAPKAATLISEAESAGFDLLGLHRYPDPHQAVLKQQLCALRNTHAHTSKTLTPANLFVGVGSDEAIDALLRCFCVPGRDKILVCPPTYGMYGVSAQVNDLGLVKVPLTAAPEFGVDVPAVHAALDASVASPDYDIKIVYLCSPGNPTGRIISKDEVTAVLNHPTWNGIVVVDEAYVDFVADQRTASLAEWVLEWPNLVVMQTLSKAFGMAGIRLGSAFCDPAVAALLNSLKAPYNIASPTSSLARSVLAPEGLSVMRSNLAKLVAQRERLVAELPKIAGVGRLRGGVDSNFLLYEMLNAQGEPDNGIALAVYTKLAEQRGVVVRFRGKEHGCLGCLRITVGTEEEVTRFLAAIEKTLAEVRGA
ncbi:histidinol-phosphate aminotransferase [Ophiostoma piceae UAMH 11346]|uniref:histidinol-phosphate transaminase n=1 Tax=Ophiostoma piceae (strain UAMH 11346) TaxID=1262450 RepID=S3BRV8_OPHP1|nr:histidinol-phosphate aminotransferase [Ophiostoma piceae UAMH 11346]